MSNIDNWILIANLWILASFFTEGAKSLIMISMAFIWLIGAGIVIKLDKENKR